MNEQLIYSLLQNLQRTDPRLHDLLRELVSTLQIINNEVFPIDTTIPTLPVAAEGSVSNVTDFSYTLIPDGIQLDWERPDTTTLFFEIKEGVNFDAGSRVLLTASVRAVLPPRLAGSYTYWIKGIGSDGTYSTDAIGLTVIVPPVGSVTITGRVIDNNVLLFWSEPTSVFRIARYLVSKDGTQIGIQTGTFINFFEQTSAQYEYGVQAVDIAGNLSPLSTISLAVTQPADYVLEAVESSVLDGTRTAVLLESELPSLIANINLTETWEDHFINNSWTTIQDQIDAGFPYFLQPTLTNGEYEEVFDYGAVFDNVIATVDWNFNQLVPSMQVDIYVSTSVDNVTYTSEISGVSIFAPSMRYLKLRIEFTALN